MKKAGWPEHEIVIHENYGEKSIIQMVIRCNLHILFRADDQYQEMDISPFSSFPVTQKSLVTYAPKTLVLLT